MSLQEAIEYIRKVTPENDPWEASDICGGEYEEPLAIDHAIATILNAVVKGELRHDNDR